MRHFMASAAIVLIGAGMAPAAPGRHPQAPELHAWHGGICSGSLGRGRMLIRRRASGALYRLSLLGGSAPEGSRRIRWNRRPHEVFIFCSPLLAAVTLADRGRLQVDLLDFVTGPPPYLESSTSLYARTCHPDEDWSATGFAARHGYRALDPEREIALSRPEDIFRHAH
jgi:hypothetical protein